MSRFNKKQAARARNTIVVGGALFPRPKKFDLPTVKVVPQIVRLCSHAMATDRIGPLVIVKTPEHAEEVNVSEQ